MADWFAGCAAINAFVRVSHQCFAVHKGEYTVRAVFHAAGLAVSCAAIAFFWKNCRIPWCTGFSHISCL
ncbi:MAG: hypothetical protein QXV01_12055, partial [Candidatus Bathyarchaeia archaeon]